MLTEFTCYSGDAIGSDRAWRDIGKQYGVGSVDFRPESLKSCSELELEEIETAYKKAVKDLGRKEIPAHKFSGGLVRRDYLQAKYATYIFAISTIEERTIAGKTSQKVAGGTGYCVQMGINLKKPVFVFDQNLGLWFKWEETEDDYPYCLKKFVEVDTPILSQKFAGVGTREINDLGIKAINEVYEKTIEFVKILEDS